MDNRPPSPSLRAAISPWIAAHPRATAPRKNPFAAAGFKGFCPSSVRFFPKKPEKRPLQRPSRKGGKEIFLFRGVCFAKGKVFLRCFFKGVCKSAHRFSRKTCRSFGKNFLKGEAEAVWKNYFIFYYFNYNITISTHLSSKFPRLKEIIFTFCQNKNEYPPSLFLIDFVPIKSALLSVLSRQALKTQ